MDNYKLEDLLRDMSGAIVTSHQITARQSADICKMQGDMMSLSMIVENQAKTIKSLNRKNVLMGIIIACGMVIGSKMLKDIERLEDEVDRLKMG